MSQTTADYETGTYMGGKRCAVTLLVLLSPQRLSREGDV